MRGLAGHSRLRSLPASASAWLILGFFALIVMVPLVFMLGSSLMSSYEIMKMPYGWLPTTWKWANFHQALAGNDGNWMFLRNIFNSLFVSLSIAFTTVFLSASVGYGLAKFRFRGRNLVFMAIMATMMIPFETVMIPLYMIVVKLGMQDSYLGLIVPFLMNAFGVFLMRQYLLGFPEEILDASRIDGCSELSIFTRIVFANSGPAAATLAILAFRQQWDNLLWPLLVVQREEMKTIPAYIVKFAAEKSADEGTMMAVAVIASIPVFALFFGLSKYFLGGAAVYSAGKE
jgi:multiple sugar transport system permease protein